MNKKTAIRKLGFFESLPIKIKGYRDGRRGLPQKDENGQWHSPHLDKEIHTYAEFSSHIWGALQTELEPSYVRLNEISDLIILTKEQLQTAKKALKPQLTQQRLRVLFVRMVRASFQTSRCQRAVPKKSLRSLILLKLIWTSFTTS